MNKNKKYGNIVPCLFGMHHFSDKHSKITGQYAFVSQECDDCHRERTVSLWQVQYEGTHIQALPKTRARPSIGAPTLPFAHKHA